MDSFYMGKESPRHNHVINSDRADLLFAPPDFENSSVFAFIDNPKEIDQSKLHHNPGFIFALGEAFFSFCDSKLFSFCY